jgi:hypothetical protein
VLDEGRRARVHLLELLLELAGPLSALRAGRPALSSSARA